MDASQGGKAIRYAHNDYDVYDDCDGVFYGRDGVFYAFAASCYVDDYTPVGELF